MFNINQALDNLPPHLQYLKGSLAEAAVVAVVVATGVWLLTLVG